jgi:non-ribosomal peptide synthetase component F
MRRAAQSSNPDASYREMDHGLYHTTAAGGNGASNHRPRVMSRRQKSIPPPIRPTARDGSLPLSFAQQRLWFLEQLAAGNSTYNMLGGVRLSGQLDTFALERTINEIVRRHEALRTTFLNTNGRLQQVVAANRSLTVELLDLRALPASEHEAAIEQLASEELRRTFDLSKGPLLRVKLLRLDEDEHVALVAMHHIISDGWSIGIFLREVKELYQAFRNGEPSPLHDLRIQYADFAQWQQEWLRGEVLEAQLDYWRSTLGGVLPVLELPMAVPRPSQPTFRSARLSLLLPAELCEGLRSLSRRRGVTLYMTLLAAFKTLLYRYTKQDDIIVGTAVAGRNYAGIEELIGVFINMLVMRTDLSGNPGFSELLDRVKEVALQAYAHQDVPFEKLVSELQPQRELSQTPLFQVAFGLQNAPVKTLHLPQLQLTPMTFNVEMARYDLTLWMIEGEEGLTASWTYSSDLFHASAVIRMQTHFESLLRSIVADPETHLSALEMYSQSEKREQAAQDEGWKEVHVQKLVSRRRRAVIQTAQSLAVADAD